MDLRQWRSMEIRDSRAAPGCSGNGNQLGSRWALSARSGRFDELPPGALPAKALLLPDEYRLFEVRARPRGKVFPAMPFLRDVARLLRRGGRVQEPVLGLRQK